MHEIVEQIAFLAIWKSYIQKFLQPQWNNLQPNHECFDMRKYISMDDFIT